MAYGGQVAVPLDIAQRFVEHCTGAPAALTEEGLAAAPSPSPHTPDPQASLPRDGLHMHSSPSLPRDGFHMHNNPLCDPGEPSSPNPASPGPSATRRISRLSTLSASDPRWVQAMLHRCGSTLPGAAGLGLL